MTSSGAIVSAFHIAVCCRIYGVGVEVEDILYDKDTTIPQLFSEHNKKD
jgi:hypothetical protein